MTSVEIRIQELRKIQTQEVDNNFENGDLWNDCEDKIWSLEKYGTETPPEIEGRGMSIYGSENW